jgi:UDP-3-O-acyl-N-acetylglucosamine deacetylase
MVGTAILCDGDSFPFTGMMVNRGVVEATEMYPFIPIPTHVGVTVFGKQAQHYFLQYFDLSKRIDFESVLFPMLSEEHKLYSFVISHKNYISVNDPKGFKSLAKALETTP